MQSKHLQATGIIMKSLSSSTYLHCGWCAQCKEEHTRSDMHAYYVYTDQMMIIL